ncbi:hypothetical protein DXG01_009543 [Tephrocybe rancida]|nr:hypothetical protein DXG01_009543 [Tephrocybe rancida]
MSSDEFDSIPDDFSGIEGIDWAQLLSAPAPSPTADPQDLFGHEASAISARSPSADSSTHYSCDDEDLDPRFFAELDNLEKDIMSQTGQTATITASPSYLQSNTRMAQSTTIPGNARQPQPIASTSAQLLQSSKEDLSKCMSSSHSRKRAREPSPIESINKKGKGKAQKENESVLQILSGFEDELTCPILQKANCAICRTELARDMPMIPNFAMDNTVEKHIAALGQSGIAEWKHAGSKLVDWLSRKEEWKKDTVERAKAKVLRPEKPPNQAFLVWEILSDEELDDVDYDDYDSGTRVVRPRRRRTARYT